MGVNDRYEFSKRMKRINKRHSKLSQGYIMSVNHDGLVIAQPKSRRMELPWRPVLFVLLGVVLFKAVLLSRIGADAYEQRVAQLAAGTQFEKVGGYVLAADPATVWISDLVGRVMASSTSD